MMVLTKSETRAAEEAAEKRGLSGLRLMENAGAAAAKHLGELSGQRVCVMCGSGNNGGDGFVTARKLKLSGAQVSVIMVTGAAKTESSKETFRRMTDAGVPVFDFFADKNDCLRLISMAEIIIDAIFGTGYNGRPDPYINEALIAANSSGAKRVALDIPTGLMCDSGEVPGICFKADETISFIGLKPCHILFPSSEFCGKTVGVAIGIEDKDINGRLHIIDPPELPSPGHRDNKYTRGVAAIDAGSYGMAGAAALCAKAASLSGAGLVKVKLIKEIYPILAVMLPQAVFCRDDKLLDKASAIAVGPGCGGRDCLSHIDGSIPAVIDADGINQLKQHIDVLERFGESLVLTPHAGELARFFDVDAAEVEKGRLDYAERLGREYSAVTVLKGARTIVAGRDGAFVNLRSHPCLATAGSGDILTGIIAAFLAADMAPLDAACAGVYVHGLCGELAAEKYGRAVNAETLIEILPEAFKNL